MIEHSLNWLLSELRKCNPDSSVLKAAADSAAF